MKRSIFFCLAVSASLAANAQKSGLYVRAGMNLADTKESGGPDVTRSVVSFQAGLMGDVVINKIFSLQPSVIFSGKGAKFNYGESGSPSYVATSRPAYIEIPVNFVVKYPFYPKHYNFFLGAGPYIAFGVSGKRDINGEIGGTEFSHNNSITFTDEQRSYDFEEYAGLGVVKKVDYGYNGIAGIRYRRAMFALNYSWGKMDIQKDINPENVRIKHNVFSILLGYRL